MKYAVTTSFYDNGRTRVLPPVQCPDDATDSCIEYWNRDTYIDVFDSLADAEEYYRNNKEDTKCA